MSHYIQIYDLVKDLDCKFLFNIEEMIKWHDNDIYCFLYGKYYKGQQSTRCMSDWKDSSLYDLGKSKINYRLRKNLQTRASPYRKDWREDKSKQPGYRSIKEKGITRWVKSKVTYPDKSVKTELIPMDNKSYDYRPLPGFNPLHLARKQAFYYTYAGKTFYFGWTRAKNFIDLSELLKGRADWPISLDTIVYDLNLDLDFVGAYPFLAHCIRYRIRLIKFTHYVDYMSKGFAL